MNLGPPPAHADEEKTPVMKELRLFALKRMADELERPSHQEKRQRTNPQPMHEYGSYKYCERKHNAWYPERMTQPVYRMLMAAGILSDPLFVGAAAQHGYSMIHGRTEMWSAARVERPSASVLAS